MWTYLACMYGKSITGATGWLSTVSAVNRTFKIMNQKLKIYKIITNIQLSNLKFPFPCWTHLEQLVKHFAGVTCQTIKIHVLIKYLVTSSCLFSSFVFKALFIILVR